MGVGRLGFFGGSLFGWWEITVSVYRIQIEAGKECAVIKGVAHFTAELAVVEGGFQRLELYLAGCAAESGFQRQFAQGVRILHGRQALAELREQFARREFCNREGAGELRLAVELAYDKVGVELHFIQCQLQCR